MEKAFRNQLPLFTNNATPSVDTATPPRSSRSSLTYAELPFRGLHKLRCATEVHFTVSRIIYAVG